MKVMVGVHAKDRESQERGELQKERNYQNAVAVMLHKVKVKTYKSEDKPVYE